MLKQISVLVILFGTVFLTSCATTYTFGRRFSTQDVKNIEIGGTTENDILNMFGTPLSTGMVNGRVVYTYCHEEIVFYHDDSIEKYGNTLIIEFDQDNRVLNYYYNIPGKGEPIIGLLLRDEALSIAYCQFCMTICTQ